MHRGQTCSELSPRSGAHRLNGNGKFISFTGFVDQSCLAGGAAPPRPPLQVGCCRSLRRPDWNSQAKSAAVAASRVAQWPRDALTWSMVWIVDYRTSGSSSHQACRFRIFFLAPIPELFLICFAVFPGNAKNNVDPTDPTLSLAFPGNA